MSMHRSESTKKDKIDWWTRELWGLRHKLRQAKKQFAKAPSNQNKENLKTLKRTYQKVIRKRKYEYLKSFCSNVQGVDLYRKLKRLAGVTDNPTLPKKLRLDGVVTQSPNIISHGLANCFFPKTKRMSKKQAKILPAEFPHLDERH